MWCNALQDFSVEADERGGVIDWSFYPKANCQLNVLEENIRTTFKYSNRQILLCMVDWRIEKNIYRAFINIHQLFWREKRALVKIVWQNILQEIFIYSITVISDPTPPLFPIRDIFIILERWKALNTRLAVGGVWGCWAITQFGKYNFIK